MSIFCEGYAAFYDQLYAAKDYEGESDLIEQAFRGFGDGQIRAVVDFGCGTGRHAVALARRGYRVTGVDVSAEMLEVARQGARVAGAAVELVQGDIRTVSAGGPFDAALFMFSVLGYMVENEDVMAALANARRHLRPHGLLLFDVWYGPAVLAIGPTDRVKVVQVPTGQVTRSATSVVDSRRQVCEVHYHFRFLSRSGSEEVSTEVHRVRFFFPMELELMLRQSGFQPLSLSAFPSLDRCASDSSWNAFGAARAV